MKSLPGIKLVKRTLVIDGQSFDFVATGDGRLYLDYSGQIPLDLGIMFKDCKRGKDGLPIESVITRFKKLSPSFTLSMVLAAMPKRFVKLFS
jgi:hypothetical protein